MGLALHALTAGLVLTGVIVTTAAAGIVTLGRDPEWSSDGTLLLHTRFPDPGLYLAEADGESLGRIVLDGGKPAVFWNDDTEIIYTRGDDLWIVNVDGSDPRVWRERSAFPIVSRDGEWLAYRQEFSVYEYVYEYCFTIVDDAHTYAGRRFLCGDRHGIYGWYPGNEHLLGFDDGQFILFALEDESIEILDGTPPDLADVRELDVSPDGERFVYDRPVMYDQPRSQLFLWQDGVETQLTDDSFIRSYSPRWSPDGRRIAYYTIGNGLGGVYYVEVMEVAPTPTRRTSWSELKGRFTGDPSRAGGGE